MDKRTFLCVVVSLGIWMGYLLLQLAWGPPPGQPPAGDQPVAQDDADGEADPDNPDPNAEPGNLDPGPGVGSVASEADPDRPPVPLLDSAPPADGDDPPQLVEMPEVEQQWISLGSFNPDSPYKLLAMFTNKGASLQRLELVTRDDDGDLRYRDLRREIGGYLGEMALVPVPDGEEGCLVRVVGKGTPADLAGIEAGDVILSVAETPIAIPEVLDELLAELEPGDTVPIELMRPTSGQQKSLSLTATLSEYPLQLMRPEYLPSGLPAGHPNSFRTSLESIGETSVDLGQTELNLLPSMLLGNWEMTQLAGPAPGVEFRFRVPLTSLDRDGALEFIKRYRLVPATDNDQEGDQGGELDRAGYQLKLEVEVRNLGNTPEDIAYRLEGPNGLTTEGWWYSYKVPQGWGGVGARDLIYRSVYTGHQLLGCPYLYKQAKKDAGIEPLFTERDEPEQQTLRYIGVDTQYFNVSLLPANYEDVENGFFKFRRAVPVIVGDEEDIPAARSKTANTSFYVVTPSRPVPAGESIVDEYVIFAGPKRADVLQDYGLSEAIEYGWYPLIARPLSGILHFFYSIVGNYGLAIILLTVVVRGAMTPFSRKAALNAKMMQELAPEMKKITEKYKKDMQKRADAQRELYRKYNFNPLSGCFLMLLQLPIFLGLYRCLCVDIELRQAPLIPGLDWCANLAGPDQFWRWEAFMPSWLASETGWLGPYLNILPIVTIILFLVQQKLFTPPPTDEQQQMQQSMMKYMMVFIGVLFFKVAAGLCLYFIASSMWGIAERKLLPKVELKKGADGEPVVGKSKSKPQSKSKAKAESESNNGAARERAKNRRKQRKRQ